MDSLSRFLWFFCVKYRLRLIGLLATGVLWALHFCLTPTFIKGIIDGIATLDGSSLYPILGPFVGYIAMAFVLLGMGTWYDYLVMKTYPSIRADVVDILQNGLYAYPYTFFQRHLSGSLAHKTAELSKGTVTIITSFIDNFFSRSLLLILGVFTLFRVHALFALALLVWAFFFFGLSYVLSKKSQLLAALFSEARSVVMGKVVDSLTNIFNIKVFGTSRYEQAYLHKHVLVMKAEEQKLGRYFMRLKFAQGITITLLMVSMIFLLLHTYQRGLITIGDFALVLSLTAGIVDQTFYLALQLVEWTEEIGQARQALAIFNEPLEPEKSHLPPLQVIQGEIVFDHVVFYYNPLKAVFQNLSLHVAPGEKVGVVGLSGSGKSTLVHLLLRLYELTAGKILIDGQNIVEVTKESLVSQIGMIPQEPYLFHRSIYENILYGKLDATEEEVTQAAQKARCHDFILELEHGYDTLVGERGVKLSGGQRQRLAIARAFLKNAPILILDEATSALDSLTEKEIQESLDLLMQSRTTLAIAHRLSTLASMDRILVFDKGRIIEEGSHYQLLQNSGCYAQLWDLQTHL